MKKLFSLILMYVGFGMLAVNVPAPSRYESFENGIPKNWKLSGQGTLSTTPWHYKHGKQSLKWDFKAGDAIRIDNTIGNVKGRGGMNNACYASFGVWVYCKNAMPEKNLRFEFRKDEQKGAYFDFPLNFKGWQCAYVKYNSTRQSFVAEGHRSFNHVPGQDVNNILIKAPENTDGEVLIDLLVYNGLIFSHNNFLPRETPWQAPKLDEKENPLPGKISDADLKAIENIEKSLRNVRIVKTSISNPRYDNIMEQIENLDIIEDIHGIRGMPINLPRWHAHNKGTIEFYTDNNIPKEELHSFDDLFYSRGKIFHEIYWGLRQSGPGITQAQYQQLGQQFIKTWRYMTDQGFNTSYGNGSYYAGTYKKVIAVFFMLREFLYKSPMFDKTVNYLQYKTFSFFRPEQTHPSMDYFSSLETFLYGAFLISPDKLKQLQVLRFFARKWSKEILHNAGHGFKPDGAGYHAYGFQFDYMQGGICGAAKIARLFAGTSFALSGKAYERLKKVALNQYFYTNNNNGPIFMQGTSPNTPYISAAHRSRFFTDSLKNLALAGKGGLDKELAQAYVNLCPEDKQFAAKYQLKKSAPPNGTISMPYAALVAHRRGDWVAVASGNKIDMRGRGNHYMYHGGNGALSIMGKDGFFASGHAKNGWDWRRINGTTCLYIPEVYDIKFIQTGRREPQTLKNERNTMKKWYKRYRDTNLRAYRPLFEDGGIAWRGRNGIFNKVFMSDRLFNVFYGIKSYFFIDGRIYAMGSDINSAEDKYHVQTNIYQKALKSKNTPTFIDGREIKKFPVNDELLDSAKDHFLIDSVGNGYYVPKGQQLYVARKEQKSRDTKYKKSVDTTGNFATAYLDHGVKCKDAKYFYVIFPYCKTQPKFEASDFEILQQDGKAHIIHDKPGGLYGAVFFCAMLKITNLPELISVSRRCRVMYKITKNKLEVAAGSQQRRHKTCPLQLTFSGKWKLETPVDGISIINSEMTKTVVNIDCIHGKSYNFTLVKQ